MKPLNLKSCHNIAFSPDGRTLAAVGKEIRLWNIEERDYIDAQKPFGNISSVCYSPNGSLIAVKNTSGLIAILESDIGSILTEFNNEDDGEGCGCVFSPCGQYVVDGSWDGGLRVRECESGEVAYSKEYPEAMIVDLTSFGDGSRYLMLVEPKMSKVAIPSYLVELKWPFDKSEAKQIAGVYDANHCFAINPTGTLVALLGKRYVLSVYSYPEMKLLAQCKIDSLYFSLSWSADSSMIAAITNCGADIYGADLKLINRITAKYAQHVLFAPHGHTVAVAAPKAGVLVNAIGG